LTQNHIEKINSILPNGMRQKNIKDKYLKFQSSLLESSPYGMFIKASSYVDDSTLSSILKSPEVDLNISNFRLKSESNGIGPPISNVNYRLWNNL